MLMHTIYYLHTHTRARAHTHILCTHTHCSPHHTLCISVYRPAVWSGAGLITNHSRANGVVTCTVHHLTGFAVLVSTAQVSASSLHCATLYSCLEAMGCLIALSLHLTGGRPSQICFPMGVLYWVCHLLAMSHCNNHLSVDPKVSAV